MPESNASFSEGLRFRKLDLHVHTPASRCFGDRSVTPERIVEAAIAKGLDGIGVTDHNSGSWVDSVKRAAHGKPLIVFPGVELTCVGGIGGIHLIAFFDPQRSTQDIESLLGNLGLTANQYGNIAALIEKDPIAVAEIVERRGGLTVLAHANSSKGVLNDMRGQQRTNLIQSRYIHAAEGTDFRDGGAAAERKRVCDLLDGTDPTYQRKLACYQASDNPSGENDGLHALSGIGGRCAFFKLDRVDIDGLRQCLADPDVRIKQDFELTSFVYPRISKIEVTGGFLDRAEAIFHGGLNSILGAKGAGKSLLIEFLRFVLNQPPKNEDIRADHTSKLASKLENYGTVQVTILDDTGKEFIISRMWDPAEAHPYTSEIMRDPSELFPVLFLSQNEIIKIAEDEDAQIAFIDQFFDFRQYQQEIGDLGHQLEALDKRLSESIRAFQANRDIEKRILSIAKEIEELDVALKNPAFDQYSQTEVKDQTLRQQRAFLAELTHQLEATHQEYELSRGPGVPASCADDPAVKRTVDVVREAIGSVLEHLESAAKKLKELSHRAEDEYSKWAPRFKASKQTYTEAVQKAGGDYKNLAQKRAKQVKEVEALGQRAVTLKQKSDQIRSLSEARMKAIDGLKGTYDRYTHERKAKCAQIEREADGRLQVRIHESSNVDEFRNRLTALKRGSYLKDSEIDAICAKTDPGTFVRAVIRSEIFERNQTLQELAKVVGIEVNRMLTLSEFLVNEFQVEELLALEHQALPQDRPEIRYDIGGGTFEILNRLSVGQKCTAMLIIALNEGSVPVVIDQPEDSLDIRTIWEDMCMKVRRGKERRQFIFTTHNSSLAVASDTDKFTILEAGADHGKVVYSGSMDHSPLSEEVINYLEGGVDAYRAKYGKYRIERAR